MSLFVFDEGFKQIEYKMKTLLVKSSDKFPARNQTTTNIYLDSLFVIILVHSERVQITNHSILRVSCSNGKN